MPRIDNLADGLAEMRAMLKEMRQRSHATPLNNASIGRNGLRLYGGGRITIENNGGITITGPDGELIGSGTINWTGTMNNTGPVNLNGDTTISKNLIVQALTRLLGELTLEADMTLTGGGKITVGAVAVDPGAGGTGGLSSDSAIRLASPQVFTTSDLNVGDDMTVGDILTVLGVIINNGMTAQTNAANVYVNPTTKQFYLVSSSLRFKIDPQPMELPDSLLDVPVKDWIDKASAERYADLLEHPRPLTEFEQLEMDDGSSLRRVPGIIAEEVAAAGGEPFVTYDAEGEIAGVAYDRLALARTQILARRLDAALVRIDELEQRLTS